MANTRLPAALARLLGNIVWQEALGLTSWCRRLLADLFSLASAKEMGAQGQETLTEIMYTGKNIAIGMAKKVK